MINYDNLLDQNPWWLEASYLPLESKLPQRKIYNKIKKHLEENLAIVITGLRRTGKSTVLYQLISDLLKSGVSANNILYFSFDKYSLDKSPNALEDLIKLYFYQRLNKKIYQIDSKIYIFIDEVQYIEFWQDIIKRYYDLNKNLKFILTGSQSAKLKSKSKESLAGRIIEYHFSVLEYNEFLAISGQNFSQLSAWNFDFFNTGFKDLYDYHYTHSAKLENLMPAYLCYGQLPEIASVKYKDNLKFAYEYIKESVLGKILEQDIPKHYGIEKVQAFKAIAYHLITNSGSIFEISNIGQELALAKTTSEKYLTYLTEGFIINILFKYLKTNIKKGRALKKAYSTSTSFIAAINNFQLDYYNNAPEVFGKLIETYVWHCLNNRFEKLFLWRQGEKEVDFLINDFTEKTKPEKKQNLLIEVKFSKKNRNNDLKNIISLAIKMNCTKNIIITKNKLDRKKINDIEIYFIPFYLL